MFGLGMIDRVERKLVDCIDWYHRPQRVVGTSQIALTGMARK